MMSTNYLSRNQGFVLLYAILVAGIISVSSIVLASIIFKQLTVSSVGQNSQTAYYAAYVGLECAKLWNLSEMRGDEKFNFENPVPSFEIQCLEDTDLNSTVDYNSQGYYDFTVENINNNSCAYVMVDKDSPESLSIYSYGYNVSGLDGNCTGSHPRKVERLIQTDIE